MSFAAPSHLGEHMAHPAAFCWKGVSSLRLCGALWGSIGFCGAPSFPSDAALKLQRELQHVAGMWVTHGSNKNSNNNNTRHCLHRARGLQST